MKKDKKYLTIQERREYLISGKPMPLSFNPIIKDKKKMGESMYLHLKQVVILL